ncbi:MAG: ATP-binding protein [Anaerolineales bacterium]|nr:ATP-binding protein [Anaerolineales bacterium]
MIDINDFVGRRSELELLDNLWQSARASFLILYGRRRVGKTRLLTHWLRQDQDRGLYWVAEPTSSLEQLRSFSQALYNFSTPDTSAPNDYTFSTWEQAFRELAKIASTRRIALFIDEVTYLMDVNPTFIGVLQKTWDQWLSKSNLMLALCGSQMGMMQKQILAYDAPLYGRASTHIQLPPMPFWTTHEFFPNYSPADRVAVHAIWGGIPAYWERLQADKSFWENVRLQLLPSNMWMMDEPSFLLKDFVNDPYNYVSILRALAHGATTTSRISTRTGLTRGHISSYLGTLRETGFVVRQVPVTELESVSRRGRYYVTDPYLRFYYHSLAAYQSKLALGARGELLETIKAELPAFIEKNTWRDLCSEWMLRASAQQELPMSLEQVGGFWHGNQEIDLVGIDRINQNLYLAVCQWSDDPVNGDRLETLVRQTDLVVPDGEEDWTVYYLGFSSAGWLPDTEATIARYAQERQHGKPWHYAGIRLVDLAEVDSDLYRWGV